MIYIYLQGNSSRDLYNGPLVEKFLGAVSHLASARSHGLASCLTISSNYGVLYMYIYTPYLTVVHVKQSSVSCIGPVVYESHGFFSKLVTTYTAFAPGGTAIAGTATAGCDIRGTSIAPTYNE